MYTKESRYKAYVTLSLRYPEPRKVEMSVVRLALANQRACDPNAFPLHILPFFLLPPLGFLQRIKLPPSHRRRRPWQQ